MKPKFRPYLLRAAIILAISIIAAFLVNEGIYLLQRESYDRAPKTIQIVIPPGSSELVARGEKLSTLPEETVFVVGDVLEVVNQDGVAHQLGPIWAPPGSTGRLVLEEANKFSFACSFSPSNYFGLDVRQPTTSAIRLTALAISAPSLAVFLFIYSFLVFPIKPVRKPVTGGPNP